MVTADPEFHRELRLLSPKEYAHFEALRKVHDAANVGGDAEAHPFDMHAAVHQYLYEHGRLPGGVTADQLRAIMPNAGHAADRYAPLLSNAMARHGIIRPEQQAAFLAQVAVESDGLRRTRESGNYSIARLIAVWPRRFPTASAAAPYAHNPQALFNHVYAGGNGRNNGNGDEHSGDGYRYRGGGLMQVTGRANYAALGYEHNPEALDEPEAAAESAARHWSRNTLRLNSRTQSELNRTGIRQYIEDDQRRSYAKWRSLGCLPTRAYSASAEVEE